MMLAKPETKGGSKFSYKNELDLQLFTLDQSISFLSQGIKCYASLLDILACYNYWTE